MKKSLIVFLLIIFLLSSCSSSGALQPSTKHANERFENLISAIETNNMEEVKVLFAENVLNNDEQFDEKINDLFNLFTGTMEAYNDWGGCVTRERIDPDGTGNKLKSTESTYDIKTTSGYYRMAVKIIWIDTANKGNVGISSLYIIRADDYNNRFAYWGDGNWTPGIVIEETETPSL